MGNAYRDEIEAALARARALEDQLREKEPPAPRPSSRSPILAGIAIGLAGVFVGFATPTPRPAQASVALPASSPEPLPIDGLHAIATPNNGSGWLDIAISDQAITCTHRELKPSTTDSFRLRLSLPPAQRELGVHRMGSREPVFSFVDRPQRRGSDISGTVEILSSSSTEIALRIDSADFTGTVKATVCGACQSTGMTCTSSNDCCTRSCGGGRCHP